VLLRLVKARARKSVSKARRVVPRLVKARARHPTARARRVMANT
jgi:hypothetical protein